MSAPGRAAPSRRVAFEVLRAVFEHGAWADRAFSAAADRAGLDPRDRAQAQALAYGAVRRRGTADALIERFASRRVSKLDPPLLAALRLGIFELVFVDRTPERAAVFEAVALARSAGAGRAGGVVNAVLRRLIRERGAVEELLAATATPGEAAVALSYPGWVARLWFDELGPADAVSLMRAMNEPAEIALRVNPLKLTLDAVRERLAEAGQALVADPGHPAPEGCLVIDGRLGDLAREMIEAGELVPQARSAQLVAARVGAEAGQRVLELCAAPGGKTTALAAQVGEGGRVAAVELDHGRAERLRAACERAGARNVDVVEGDAETVALEGGYDRVLLDPPCSDLGTLDSRPDARWRKSRAQVGALAAVQRRLLVRAGGLVAAGGRVVYSVCTLTRAEGEAVVADPPAGLELEAAEVLRPDVHGTSGFFIATLAAGGGRS